MNLEQSRRRAYGGAMSETNRIRSGVETEVLKLTEGRPTLGSMNAEANAANMRSPNCGSGIRANERYVRYVASVRTICGKTYVTRQDPITNKNRDERLGTFQAPKKNCQACNASKLGPNHVLDDVTSPSASGLRNVLSD